MNRFTRLLLPLLALLLLFTACSDDETDPYAEYYTDDATPPEDYYDGDAGYDDWDDEVMAEAPGDYYYEEEQSLEAAPEASMSRSEGDGFASAAGGVGVTDVDMAEEGYPAGDEVEAEGTTEADTLGQERKLIYDTDMTLVVDDLSDSREEVEQLIKAHHKEGVTDVIITSQNVYRQEGSVGYVTYEIRCHADVREKFVAALRDIGEVVSENATVEDVTRRYYDLEKQHDLLEADYEIAKAAFDEAVARNARSEELEELKAELEYLSEELGYTKTALKGLDDLITLPTITLTLTEDEASTTFRGWKTVKNGFELAYMAIVNILRVFIVVIGVALILALLILPTFLLIRWMIKLLNKGKTHKEE
ncbi:DUF4349 domain-containing protein [bacterium]|nr:DUF4349 domain-containing protein [bacterium]